MSSRRKKAARGFGWLPFAGLLLVVLVGFAYNLRWLLAEAYSQYALESLSISSSNADGLRAAELSTELAPFSYSNQVQYAWLLLGQQRSDAGLSEFRKALRTAPADPFLWQEYVNFKLNLGEFDSELELALSRVNALAPYSYELQFSNALLATQYWNWAGAGIRKEWLHSMQFALAADPVGFLRPVLASRREDILCQETGLKTPFLDMWCPGATQARRICFAPNINKGAARWCYSIGLVADSQK